jgi:hypothetical protein
VTLGHKRKQDHTLSHGAGLYYLFASADHSRQDVVSLLFVLGGAPTLALRQLSFAFLQLLKLGIFCRIAKIPGLDNVFLSFVDDLLIVDVLDANAEAVLSEDDVLLIHLLM